MAREGEGEVHNLNGEQPRIGGGRGGGRGSGEDINPEPFGFIILDEDTTVKMKNISPSILPNFHGLRSDDLEKFLFEFEVLCRSYDYLHDGQKLKLFPATLKDATLKWFMSLGINSIRTWKQVKTTFLEEYKDYCMPHNIKDEVFKMVQIEDEILKTLLKDLLIMLKRKKSIISIGMMARRLEGVGSQPSYLSSSSLDPSQFP